MKKMVEREKRRPKIARVLAIVLTLVMIVSSVISGPVNIYASEVGHKNQQACDSCDMVKEGNAPSMKDYSSSAAGTSALNDRKQGLDYGSDGYSLTEETYERLLNGAVYRGGNAASGLQPVNSNAPEGSPDRDPTIFDADHDDFANVLPYGNTYINTGKLSWTNSNNFKIDIADTQHFKWIAGSNYASTKDANGTPVDTDPLGGGRGLASGVAPIIAYVGHLNGYLGDDDAAYRGDAQASPASGHENIFDAGSGYLYKITYPEAVTLKDGTKGDLIIEVNRVEIETTATQDDAIVTLQTANDINVGGQLKDASGTSINVQTFVAKTKSEVEAATAGNSAWTYGGRDKSTRTATGAIIDFSIKVVDAAGNPVKGSISYAASDMDLDSYQSLWGRSSAGEDRYKFNESVTIIDGSLSYAVTPYYDHANGDMRVNGWIPVAYGQEQLSSPLHITQTGMGDGQHANGVRFSGVGTVMIRDENDKFENALFDQWGNIITVYGGQSHSSDTNYKDVNKNTIPDVVKQQLYGKIKNGNTVVPVDQMTNQQILDYIGQGSYGSRRGDNGTYETGFAVLLNATESKMRWSGSMQNGGNLTTRLFDTTIYTYIEQTHGTGGGIYFETYDVADNCKVNRAEGTVTMGKGTDATVTVVPEDGYHIDTIQIGKKELGNPRKFTPVYDTGGTVTTIKDHNGNEHAVSNDGKVTISDTTYGSITFDVNDGGSIDVTLSNMDDPRHIHADFTADYYFYKVWKDNDKDPTSLTLTATPYAYKYKEVTIGTTKYTISGNTFTNTENNKTYTLEENVLKIGEEPNIEVYYLEGNDLVSYYYTDPEDPSTRTEDKRYTIRLDYEQNGSKVTFKVTKTDADNPAEENVIKATDSDGYPVWKIRYPAAGHTTKGGETWPALPIETAATAHNINHVERNYWFVTEDAPGWALVEYDNSEAEAPGVIDVAKNRKEIYKVGKAETGDDTSKKNYSSWALTSIKDNDTADKVIKHSSNSNHAYMSVFADYQYATTQHQDTWGGKIVNIPLVVVNAEKTWDDFSNAFKTRQDVWFHVDATIDGTTTKDILPPQKLAATESGNVLKKTWGNKSAYGDDYLSEYAEDNVNYSKVKVVGTTSDLPKDTYYAQDKNNPHKYNPMVVDGFETIAGDVHVPKYKLNEEGTVYYVNELTGVDAKGKTITYSIRETDAKGNELNKSDESKYLIGYKSEVSKVEKDNENATLDGVGVPSYTGKVKNTLETVDFTVTKIWNENGASRTHTLADDVTKLKSAFTLNESGKMIEDTEKLNLQPSTAETYVADPESGTLETKNGADETEVVFTWHNIPKYVGDGSSDKPHLAVYSVVETPLSGYNAPDYDNGSTDAEGKSGDTTAAFNKGEITNEVTPPEATPKQTWGEKDQPQTANGKDMFNVTTETDLEGSTNEIKDIKLIDPNTDEAVTSVTVPEGTYTIDGDGKITFTPNPGFVGDPTPVGVRGIDSNGLSADTTYTPHVYDTETTVKRTIVYEYENGDPVLDGEGNPKTVVQEVTFKGVVNPDTGEITYPGNPTETFPEVPSDEITGYTVDRSKVDPETVRPRDNDLFEKVIYSPQGVSAAPDRTYGLPNEPQTGELTFAMDTPIYTDETPNELTIKLIDPTTGEETDEKTVPAVDGDGNIVGTYTLDVGTITFTPNTDYVGNPMPAEVTATDRFGTKAKTTYTPHIVDPVEEGKATRTIHYTYLTEDGDEVTGDTKQTVTLKRHAKSVDPETGEVLEWDNWEPETFPAVNNPDDKLKDDGVTNFGARTWSTDDSADELEVTEPGDLGVQNIVYVKEPYTVVYHDGDHGTSDGGDQEGEDYNSEVTGGNSVTPSKGYKFTGRYSYVIKDKNGNIIESGTTDDPKSLKVTGNIEFTPVYEKLPTYNINYDKNGGTGSMDDNNYASDDSTMPYDENTFVRKGYHFRGFLAYLKNPETGEETPILDANGEPIVFTGSEDMSEYFKDMPDRTSIRMEAQWKPDSYTIKYDANGGQGTMDPQHISGADGVANSKTNEFTRSGYSFKGFKAVLPNGSTLKDDSGNDLIFQSAKDFFDYLAEHGDGAEVTLIAQWEPTPTPAPSPAAQTGDPENLALWLTILVLALMGTIAAKRKA